MSSKLSLPATLEVQQYEPVLARYNLLLLAATAFLFTFFLGVTVDVYFGY
ncbi:MULTISPECIES: hypothetical protein [Natrialbaceae]|nr:hypothetical protein [Natronococcus sp. CG52]